MKLQHTLSLFPAKEKLFWDGARTSIPLLLLPPGTARGKTPKEEDVCSTTCAGKTFWRNASSFLRIPSPSFHILFAKPGGAKDARIFINPTTRRPFPPSPSLKFMWQEANVGEMKFASCFAFSKPHFRGFDLSRIILSNATNIFFYSMFKEPKNKKLSSKTNCGCLSPGFPRKKTTSTARGDEVKVLDRGVWAEKNVWGGVGVNSKGC